MATCWLCRQPISDTVEGWSGSWVALRPVDGDLVPISGGVGCPTSTGEITGHIPVVGS